MDSLACARSCHTAWSSGAVSVSTPSHLERGASESMRVSRRTRVAPAIAILRSTTFIDNTGSAALRHQKEEGNHSEGRRLPTTVGSIVCPSRRRCPSFVSASRDALAGPRSGGRNGAVGAVSAERAKTSVSTEFIADSFSPSMEQRKMALVFVGAEAAPWSKVGGLGDVMGALPPALAARGHRVMTISPRYDQYHDAWDTNVTAEVSLGGEVATVRFFHSRNRGVDRVFVDHPLFLETVWGMTGQKIYGERVGVEYPENPMRFAIFCQAALQAPLLLHLAEGVGLSSPYGEDVVFIVNDWHAALVPLYLKSRFQSRGTYANAKVAMCVHNLAYQGQFREGEFDYSTLDLPAELRPAFEQQVPNSRSEKSGEVLRVLNWMKAGFEYSDLLLTVSPAYATEVSTEHDRGAGLQDLTSRKGMLGIMNGADVTEWSPVNDKFLPHRYDVNSVFDVKPSLKQQLQAEAGFAARPEVPLFGFMGRLDEQKGSDILAAAVLRLVEDRKGEAQFIMLGTGKAQYEKQLQNLETRFPGQVRAMTRFSPRLAHMIIAGCDFMVLPSRFEPAGLVQLHAMLYGTIPVVASTGGFWDSVRDGVTGLHMGKFGVKPDGAAEDAVKAVAGLKRAIQMFSTPHFRDMVVAAMSQDLSWKGPARAWEQALLNLLKDARKEGRETTEVFPGEKVEKYLPARGAAKETLPATISL
ncbi:hypothetical protein CBR_g50684 [Chara braunii]|uniref:Starch synthase catalytic domain-containing protein n=1 Tax=Chara braunii TaxID=69332 RepID=A0A388M769_CHABU|nr:hypothetical protein CBR_g50684 [Chara braunii]|eukprot:GBG90437.1 hypothetical protein CBR_g50684 [Chara braunii]